MFPSVLDVLGSWRDITRFPLLSLLAMALLQAASLACLWALQHVALRASQWRPVITSQLAGNALAKVAPGGGAMGGALQYKLLVRAGLPGPATASALTVVNVLVFAVVLAMPVLAIPALIRGGVDKTLFNTALIGLAVFAVAFGVGRAAAHDRPAPGVDRPPRPARAQPAAPEVRAARSNCHNACCASATASSRRSARSGSAR